MGNCCKGETKENTKPSIEAISIADSEIFVQSASDLDPLAETPTEKRWQSTRRSPPRVATLGPEHHAVPESWIEQKKALAVAATSTKLARAATAKLAGAAAHSRGRAVQEVAAVVIQSAFRSYLEIDRATDENTMTVEMDLVGSNRSTSSIKSYSGSPQAAQTNRRGSSSSISNRAYSKQEKRDLSLIKPSAHVGSRPRAQSMRYDEYYFDTAKSSPRDFNMMASPYAENTEPIGVKKLERSLSTPKTGASSQKKATQAGLRLDSNVDPWLAKLARLSGAAKKGNRGSSSGTSHTKTYRPWQI